MVFEFICWAHIQWEPYVLTIAIKREFIVDVYAVHRLNATHSIRILFALVSLHLLEVPVLMIPSLLHEGDVVYRRHGPSTC